jgi:hypothetical protein
MFKDLNIYYFKYTVSNTFITFSGVYSLYAFQSFTQITTYLSLSLHKIVYVK